MTWNYSVVKSLTEEDFWPQMESDIRSTWAREKDAIRELSKELNISRLCHFTIAANLKSVFNVGLRSREFLRKQNIQHSKLETANKIYFQDFVYISISTPNTKMIYSKFRLGTPLAILYLQVKLLWKLPFFAIPMNSARSEILPNIKKDYSKYLGVKGLQDLFLNSTVRYKHDVRRSEPTDIQSELIFLDPIPANFFQSVKLTPMNETSIDFLTLANDFEFFKSGVIQKHEFKWLKKEEIDEWGPRYSLEAQIMYNERNWREEWNANGN